MMRSTSVWLAKTNSGQEYRCQQLYTGTGLVSSAQGSRDRDPIYFFRLCVSIAWYCVVPLRFGCVVALLVVGLCSGIWLLPGIPPSTIRHCFPALDRRSLPTGGLDREQPVSVCFGGRGLLVSRQRRSSKKIQKFVDGVEMNLLPPIPSIPGANKNTKIRAV